MRAAQPFVELNCAAMPESLIERALSAQAGRALGRRCGASTASSPRRRAEPLLDEVAELSPSAQAEAAAVPQSHVVHYPLGSTRTRRLRIVAATNVGTSVAVVADGKFREDLLYRPNVLPIRMPSLAERRDDIADPHVTSAPPLQDRHRLPA